MEAPGAVGERLEFRTNEPLQWYAREGDWKLIFDDDGAELFHLPTDPDEKLDLSERHPVVLGYLTSLIMDRSPAFRGQVGDVPAVTDGLTPAELRELDETLRALGYIE